MSELTRKQKEIVEASIKLISEKSIQGMTIKNLAAKLGVTEGALYRHFPGKFEILLAILSNFRAEAKANLKKVCSNDESALDNIENIFSNRLKKLSEKPAIASVIFSESIFQNDTRLSKEVYGLLGNHEDVLNCIIRKGQKTQEIRDDISAEEITHIIIGSIRYFITRWRLSEFGFDLISEGNILLNNIITLIKK